MRTRDDFDPAALRLFYAYRFASACLPYLPVAAVCFRARGLSMGEVMALSTIYCVAIAALGVPMAPLADRLGHRRALVASAGTLAGTCLLVAAADDFYAFAAAQLAFAVAGALEAGSDSAYLHAFVEVHGGSERAYRLCETRAATVKLAGNVAAFAAGGALAAIGPGVPFFAAAVLASVAALCAQRLPELPAEKRPAPLLSPAHYLESTRALLGALDRRRYVVLAALTAAMARVAVTTTGPFLTSQRVPLVAVGLLTAAGAALAAVAASRAVALADRFGERTLLAALPVALLGCHLALGLGGGVAAIALTLVPQVIAGLHAPLWRSHLGARLPNQNGRAIRGTALALDATFARLGHALLSSVLAVLAKGGGPRAALRGCTIIGALLLLALALLPTRSLLGAGTPVAKRRRMMNIRLGWGLASLTAIAMVLGAHGGIAKADADGSLVASVALPVPVPAAKPDAASSDDALLDRLCNQPIAKLTVNPRGTTIKFKAQLADGTRAQLRPAQASEAGYHRADVAAYRLARVLGLETVPPACLRTVNEDDLLAATSDAAMRARIQREVRAAKDGTVEVSMTAWIDHVVPAGLEARIATWRPQLSLEHALPANSDDAAEASRLLAWDFLIANWDRWSGSNTFRLGRHGPAVWLDNAAGFGRYSRAMKHRNEKQLDGVSRFSRSFIESLRALDDEELRVALAPAALSEKELNQLFARKDALLARVDALIEHEGDDAVLCFE